MTIGVRKVRVKRNGRARSEGTDTVLISCVRQNAASGGCVAVLAEGAVKPDCL